MDGRRPFEPLDLDDLDERTRAGLARTARALEELAATETANPSAGFEERVMRAVRAAPPPRIRFGSGLVAAARDAWAIATAGTHPLGVRTQAMAFLMVLVLAFGSAGTVLLVGAARVLAPDGPPPSVAPIETPIATPTRGPEPSPTPSPSPSPTPPPSPSPSARPSPTPRPTATDGETPEPTGTDDHGGGSGSGSSGSGSGSGRSDSGSDDEAPEPTG